MKKHLFILIIVLGSVSGYSQEILNPRTEKGYEARCIISSDGDTIPVLYFSEFYVWGNRSFKNSDEAVAWNRLVRNVKKAYPYAKIAGERFIAYNDFLSGIDNKKLRKTYMKKAEQDIQDEFGDQLKKLTYTQGRILIKLIDRQTTNSSYDIVKMYRGGGRAFFYQSFARIFGFNLKTKYDPLKEDADIERIVMMIENGVI